VRTKEQIVGEMLSSTTDMMFDSEKKLIWDERMLPGVRLLDVGCGNGAYLNCLRGSYPTAELTGVEVNERMYEQALQASAERIAYVCGSYDAIPAGKEYDIVLMRLVVHYLTDKQHLARWLDTVTHPGSVVIVIDIDEDNLHHNRGLPLFSELYDRFRGSMAKSRLLTVKDALRLEFAQGGFAVRVCEAYRIDACGSGGEKRNLYAYMRLVIEYMFGDDIPSAYLDELQAWLDDPYGSHSIHMFAMVLQMSGVPGASDREREVRDGVV
jgi:SAM-dependent methyltransferase